MREKLIYIHLDTPAQLVGVEVTGDGQLSNQSSGMRVLLIEDDNEAAKYMIKGLRESGHVVDHAADGEDGLGLANSGQYDILVVDRMLPKIDGITLVQRLRSKENRTPVLFLSALGEVEDRVKGLKVGGDDYLVKPYAFSELLARIEALGRRKVPEPIITSLKVADLEIDLLSRHASRARKSINLQPREFHLLEYLMRHSGQVVTRTMLLENVWEYHFDPQTNVIDVHISRLRSKIDKGFEKPLLHTIRGAGYCLRESD
jgi:two-component system OmpR family response regulator